MELIRSIQHLRPEHRGSVATVGVFDGVHRGHQVILDQVKNKAKELGLPSVVMVFEPHPEEFFNKEGLLEGTRIVYFANGKVAEITDYKNGKLNGVSKTYGESGKLLQQSTYANDKLNGPTIYYNLYGETKAKGEFKNNLKTGIWEYYANGVLSKKVDHDIDKIIYKKQ